MFCLGVVLCFVLDIIGVVVLFCMVFAWGLGLEMERYARALCADVRIGGVNVALLLQYVQSSLHHSLIYWNAFDTEEMVNRVHRKERKHVLSKLTCANDTTVRLVDVARGQRVQQDLSGLIATETEFGVAEQFVDGGRFGLPMEQHVDKSDKTRTKTHSSLTCARAYWYSSRSARTSGRQSLRIWIRPVPFSRFDSYTVDRYLLVSIEMTANGKLERNEPTVCNIH